MSPGQQVHNALLGASAVTALVGTRIYPARMPPAIALPAVVYTTISKVSEDAFELTTAETLKSSRVQVDCYARQYQDAQALAEAIENYLTGLTDAAIVVEFADSRDLFENDTLLHRVSTDFTVWSS